MPWRRPPCGGNRSVNGFGGDGTAPLGTIAVARILLLLVVHVVRRAWGRRKRVVVGIAEVYPPAVRCGVVPGVPCRISIAGIALCIRVVMRTVVTRALFCIHSRKRRSYRGHPCKRRVLRSLHGGRKEAGSGKTGTRVWRQIAWMGLPSILLTRQK